MPLNKELVNNIISVTSKAAISCYSYVGKNNKIIADKATTIIGVKDAILCASAKVRYRNDKTKHPDSNNDNTLLKNCNFKLLEI